MKKLLAGALFAASAFMATSALAGPTTWTSIVDQNQHVGFFDAHSYIHDLTAVGFAPPPSMEAFSGSLQIDLYDDGCDVIFCADEFILETLIIQVENFDFDTGGLAFLSNFNGELEVEALLAINTDGKLDVTIRSLTGDFNVGRSTLTVQGVPEPSLLGMFGASLLGLTFLRRRKFSAKV